ncbi:hypothetical protein G7054_g13709 [Neopestalotiopsis clavispora]|nr:hypothetical protein G7054_g13709 [Neopestalotiopsis clavispora]
MGSLDVPPDHAPSWLIPLSTVLLGLGVVCWDLTYIFTIRRSLATKSYGLPAAALVVNITWEVIYGWYVSEAWLERAGFTVWFLLNFGCAWTTVRFAPLDWAHTSPWVGRHMAGLMAGLAVVCLWGHWSFVSWWLAEPHRGFGDKTGKWYFGRDGYDTTELAFWSAAVAGLLTSACGVAMLINRGHSGGTDYKIWVTRFIGTLCGMPLCNGLLWWYWPEAHGYFLNPFAIFLVVTAIGCDLIYLFVLYQVRKTERQLPDGRLVRGDDLSVEKPKNL